MKLKSLLGLMTSTLVVTVLIMQQLTIQKHLLIEGKSTSSTLNRENKNTNTYRTTYVPDKDENKFLKYTDKYDARTRTRKVTNRNKVMRKVKKIKENKKIMEVNSQKLNWIHDNNTNSTYPNMK